VVDAPAPIEPDAPVTAPVDAPPSRHTDARILLAGVDARAKKPDADTATTVDAGAAKPMGTLRIAASPWCKVAIDGKAQAKTAPRDYPQPAGKHETVGESTASAPPQRETRTVEVIAGQTVVETFKFTP